MAVVGILRRGQAWDDAFTLRAHPHAEAHRAYMRELLGEGSSLEAGGPLQPLDEPLRSDLVGLVVFGHDDVGQSTELLTNDPAVRATVIEAEVLPWLR